MSMRGYVREHFGQLLREFRERSADSGPADGLKLDALTAAQGLSEGDPSDWAALAHAEGSDGLLRGFCEARGISQEPEGRERALLFAELQNGYHRSVWRS